MDLGTLLEGKRVLTSTTLPQMESVGQLIRKLYKAYQFRMIASGAKRTFTQGPISPKRRHQKWASLFNHLVGLRTRAVDPRASQLSYRGVKGLATD
jgi:hypothetical protein